MTTSISPGAYGRPAAAPTNANAPAALTSSTASAAAPGADSVRFSGETPEAGQATAKGNRFSSAKEALSGKAGAFKELVPGGPLQGLKRGLTRMLKMMSPLHRPLRGTAELVLHFMTGGTSLMILGPKHFLEGFFKVDSIFLRRRFGKKLARTNDGKTLVDAFRNLGKSSTQAAGTQASKQA